MSPGNPSPWATFRSAPSSTAGTRWRSNVPSSRKSRPTTGGCSNARRTRNTSRCRSVSGGACESGKPRVALGFFDPFQFAHCVIESREIALFLRKQRAECRHKLGVARNGGEQRVVRPARKESIIARKARPRILERPVFVLQLGEHALLSGAFFLHRRGTLVECCEPRAVFANEGVEFEAPAPGFGVSLALRGRS